MRARFVSVVGTRPQLIKTAALLPALRGNHEHVLVDTGQHWDDDMAGTFFRELDLPRPDHSLGIGGGTNTEQTARMLSALEPILLAEQTDAVLVYGDTNSTLAGALAAARLGLPVAHVEAGLRSFDRRMPEEVNRVVSDHLARWLFAPTPTAVANLRAEGITSGVSLVGDLMQDLAARIAPEIRDPATLPMALSPGRYLFATIHRAENREADAVRSWAALLSSVATAQRSVVLALHPGTRVVLEREAVDLGPHVLIIAPQGYRTSLALQLHAAAVLTDSGGVQRESAWLGTPCLVLRDRTEWIEAVENSGGRMVVVGLDADRAATELERLAPIARAPIDAAERAASLCLEPAGAAEAITVQLAKSL